MPSGDYSAVGGGALKLKGAKVQKKKKKRDKSVLEKSLSATEGTLVQKDSPVATEKQADDGDANNDRPEDHVPSANKTESERKYDEIRKKRVSIEAPDTRNSEHVKILTGGQLQKMAESSSSRPELLKTHKERVEELNTYLSKLSEHHDMPKIGPG